MKSLTCKYVLFIITVSLLPLVSIFTTSQLVHTHDGLVHLPRIAAFYKALLDGQIPVRWAGDLNYGYGMPLFIFIYHLPYLVSSLFLLLGFGLTWSFKLSLMVSFLLSGVFMFIFAKAFFKDEKKALLVTLVYQFAPYHLVDLLIRGSFGEVYTYAFLPLVLFAVVKYFATGKRSYFALIAFATSLLIISHNSISLLFFGIAACFIFFFSPDNTKRVKAFLGLCMGLLITAYYWIPALLEHKYTYADVFMRDLYRNHFPALWKLFFPNFNDAAFLQTDDLSLQFGVMSVAAVIVSVYLFLLRRIKSANEKRIVIFSLGLILLSLAFMHTSSRLFWENISLLRQFQFPWRFLAIDVFSTALLASFFTVYLRRTWAYSLVILMIIVSSIIYWQPKEGFDLIDEKYYWNFPLTSTYYGETDVIWSAGPAKTYPENPVVIVDGEGKVLNFAKKSNLRTFDLKVKKQAYVVSHTQYFPGWRVYIDGRMIPVQFQNPDYRGLITFYVPSGEHSVLIKFEESKTRLVSNTISIIALISLIVFIILRRKP